MSSGPAAKSPERRQRRNARAEISLSPRTVPPPEPPENLLPEVLDAWHAYWRSDLSGLVVDDTDLPALVRLFRLRDQQARASQSAVDDPLVEGSQGQLVLNPSARLAGSLESPIRQLEDRFGLTPEARLRLGVSLGQAAASLRDLAAAAAGDDEGPEPEEPGADPRLAVPELAPPDPRAGGVPVDGAEPRPR